MIRVQTSTTLASPVIAERSTIQLAPQIEPSPTVEVKIAKPCGPRPKTRSAKPGNSSIKPRVPIVVTAKSSSMGPIPECRQA